MRLGINKWDLEEDGFLQRCITECKGNKHKAATLASSKMNRTYYACLRRMYTRMPYVKPRSLQIVVVEAHDLRTMHF